MQDFKYAKVSSNTFSKYAELRVCSDELDEAATQSDSSTLAIGCLYNGPGHRSHQTSHVSRHFFF